MATPVVSTANWAWQRQSVWSQTANKLKATAQRSWRWRLGLTVTAAALALAGSQLKDVNSTVAVILAIAAAVALAGVGLLRTRQTLEQTRQWTRARSVSEALKTEVILFLTRVGQYDGADADERLHAEVQRLERDAGDLARYTAREQPKKRGLPAISDVGTYLDVRVREQQLEGYYEPKARSFERLLGRLKIVEVALILLAAALAVVATISPNWGAWAAVVTTAGGAIAAYIASERYEFLWIEFAQTASQLRRLMETRRADDGTPLPGPELVSACEQVISVQNQAWMAKWGEEDDAESDGGDS